jgi:cation diffusion facilitator CzcD-associated flavoprotein CzcO
MTVGTIVIGAGPAGLATSRELKRRGLSHVVLERGNRPGYTWAHLYDSLVLHTGKHLSSLPGLRFADSVPLFPSRLQFLDYLLRYTATFDLPVTTGADVETVARLDGAWCVRTRAGQELRAKAVVVATGIASNPVMPAIPNRDSFTGRVRHSIEYKNASGTLGHRMLVVGAGNSAGEIAAELSRAGARITLAVRNGATVVPREVLGIPLQYVAIPFGYLPRAIQRGAAAFVARASALSRRKPVLPAPALSNCSRVPLIGFHLADEIRRGAIQIKGGVSAFTTAGVRFADGSAGDFDDVIFATGFRAAMGMCGDAVRRDSCGFGLRRKRVVGVDQSDLYFVGHNPDIRGALFTIARDARRVAGMIRRSQ